MEDTKLWVFAQVVNGGNSKRQSRFIIENWRGSSRLADLERNEYSSREKLEDELFGIKANKKAGISAREAGLPFQTSFT
jgi:hypothetical protein